SCRRCSFHDVPPAVLPPREAEPECPPQRGPQGEGQALRPLHHLDSRTGEQLLEPQGRRLLRLQPVEVDVNQGTAAPPVLADQGEGRRLHLARLDPEPPGDAAGEDGLAAPQLAREEKDTVRRQLGGERRAEAQRLLLVRALPAPHLYRPPARWEKAWGSA